VWVPGGLVIDTSTGATVSETPYLPAGWLNDGRLLVVGLASTVPQGTPPPRPTWADPANPEPVLRLWEARLKEDPAVRVVYAVSFEGPK
jgi:hypothetical protein